MAVAIAPDFEQDVDPVVAEAVTRILNSPQFMRAETQRKLLHYLWLNRQLALSEYAIATEALGRNSNFDPNTDASIRVHISRLRRKLKDYYAETGEPELLVIPTGSHQLIVQALAPSAAVEDVIPTEPEQVPSAAGWLRQHTVTVLAATSMVLLLLLAVATGFAVWQHRQLNSGALRPQEEPNGFWKAFLEGDAPIKIVLPTPIFFSFHNQPSLRIRSVYVNSFDELKKDPALQALAETMGTPGLEQSYTVTWDTLAGIQISRYLDHVGQGNRISLEVTRDSSLLSLEQANVIVLGTDNTLRPMREYIDSMNFVLTPGEERVINTRPEKGEQPEYRRVFQVDPKYNGSSVRHVEPSIIALLPGRAAGLKVLMLESRDTSGMVSLISSRAGSNAVEKMWREHGSPKYFEMVTMTEMEGNKPLRSWPVTLHAYTKTPPASGL